jgi:hypothetical protein
MPLQLTQTGVLQTSEQYTAVLRRERERSARRARRGRARYAAVDLGYPRPLWGIWDFTTHDTVRDDGATRRFTSLTRVTAAASRLNEQEGR